MATAINPARTAGVAGNFGATACVRRPACGARRWRRRWRLSAAAAKAAAATAACAPTRPFLVSAAFRPGGRARAPDLDLTVPARRPPPPVSTAAAAAPPQTPPTMQTPRPWPCTARALRTGAAPATTRSTGFPTSGTPRRAARATPLAMSRSRPAARWRGTATRWAPRRRGTRSTAAGCTAWCLASAQTSRPRSGRPRTCRRTTRPRPALCRAAPRGAPPRSRTPSTSWCRAPRTRCRRRWPGSTTTATCTRTRAAPRTPRCRSWSSALAAPRSF